MKASLKVISLFLVLFVSTSCLYAQDKYDYAVVKFYPPYLATKGIMVSISGKEFQKIDVKKDDLKDVYDCTPVLNYVQKMTDDGWRVINTITEGTTIGFILEKKRN